MGLCLAILFALGQWVGVVGPLRCSPSTFWDPFYIPMRCTSIIRHVKKNQGSQTYCPLDRGQQLLRSWNPYDLVLGDKASDLFENTQLLFLQYIIVLNHGLQCIDDSANIITRAPNAAGARAYRIRTMYCLNFLQSASSSEFKLSGGWIQNRSTNILKSSSRVVNDLNVIKKALLNFGSVSKSRSYSFSHQ